MGERRKERQRERGFQEIGVVAENKGGFSEMGGIGETRDGTH